MMTRLFDRDGALAALQRHDIEDWLPNDLLIKLDRCLMRHGVEGRTPFVDRKMSAYGFALPVTAKIGNGDGKHIVKSWLAERMPAAGLSRASAALPCRSALDRRRKHRFLAPLVAAQPGIAAVMRPEDARSVIENAGRPRRAAGLACCCSMRCGTRSIAAALIRGSRLRISSEQAPALVPSISRS